VLQVGSMCMCVSEYANKCLEGDKHIYLHDVRLPHFTVLNFHANTLQNLFNFVCIYKMKPPPTPLSDDDPGKICLIFT
jgi:hypothetical protein